MNLDSARQSQIEALPSERGGPSPRGKGDEEDRFGEVVASPNSPNLTERRITGNHMGALKKSLYFHETNVGLYQVKNNLFTNIYLVCNF